MKTLGAMLLSSTTLLSCATAAPTPEGPKPLELGGRFDGGADTCVLLLDLNTGESWAHGGAVCDTARAPYSTFKVPHALIGLELGELSGVRRQDRLGLRLGARGLHRRLVHRHGARRRHDAGRGRVAWRRRVVRAARAR